MQRYFEGFNMPRLVIDGVIEPMAVSIARVEEHYGLSKLSRAK